MRSRFQGVWNVVRFNWPYYALGGGVLLTVLLVNWLFSWPGIVATAVLVSIVIVLVSLSLLVTHWVYDVSGLYKLEWLNSLSTETGGRIMNITAGFDETSSLLAGRFRNSGIKAFDFFDPKRHTEPSILRARSAYPPFPGTRRVSTNEIPLEDDSVDNAFAFLSAHEIRDQTERTAFFTELRRVVAPDGRIIVVEHVRDTANFLAYNIGAFHFIPRWFWLESFAAAALRVEMETKITPFITVFFLKRIGTES